MAVTFEEARRMLGERLGERSLGHSLRVAEFAERMARIYAVDVEQARLAGLLHDWDRDRTPEELVADAERLGLPITDVDRARPYLLHASTGAAGIAEVFPDLPPAVVSAVRKHTVGAVDMSDLDMLVYAADMLEPSRRYEGVDGLRDLVGRVTLRELFERCYGASLAHLVAKRKQLHPATVEVWNALVGEGGR